MKSRIISYWTHNTPYEEVMKERLNPSIIKWGYRAYLMEVPNLGNWKKNTDYKPKFILDMLEKTEEDLVWLDSDATIEKEPVLFDNIPEEYDIALHYLDWDIHYKQYHSKPTRIKEALSGTMFFRNNEKVKELCRQWYKDTKDFNWEQEAMKYILERNDIGLKIYELPPEYCCVVTKQNEIPDYIQDPVIIHWQASRILKRFIL